MGERKRVKMSADSEDSPSVSSTDTETETGTDMHVLRVVRPSLVASLDDVIAGKTSVGAVSRAYHMNRLLAQGILTDYNTTHTLTQEIMSKCYADNKGALEAAVKALARREQRSGDREAAGHRVQATHRRLSSHEVMCPMHFCELA